jgi:HEPN domain-containing protein
MVDVKLIAEWLQKADEDFAFAASIIEASTFYAQICFHFQQSAEKYLKAVIVADDLEFQKVHDLATLLKNCLKRRPELSGLMSDCKLLNRFDIDTRYPVHWPTETSL